MGARDDSFGGGSEVLLRVGCGFDGEGVSSFDFVEDIGSEFFETLGREGS